MDLKEHSHHENKVESEDVSRKSDISSILNVLKSQTFQIVSLSWLHRVSSEAFDLQLQVAPSGINQVTFCFPENSCSLTLTSLTPSHQVPLLMISDSYEGVAV